MISKSLLAVSIVTLIVCLISASSQQDDPKKLKVSEKSPQLYIFSNAYFGGHSRTASHYNSSTKEWESTTDMTEQKSHFCGAVAGTKIYLFGGIGPKRVTERSEVYDCETGTYSQYRSLPDELNDCAAAVLDGFIYLTGGSNGGDDTSSSLRLNLQTTRWENIADMKESRHGHQLISLGGFLYAIGGIKTEKSVSKYDPTTNKWSVGPSTHYNHEEFSATVHDGKIFVHSYEGFEVYDPDTEEWEKLPRVGTYERNGRTLASMNGKLWAFGARLSDRESLKEVYSFEIATKKWSKEADMDIPRDHSLAFVVNH